MSSQRHAPGLMKIAAGLGLVGSAAAAGAIRACYRQQQQRQRQVEQENERLAHELQRASATIDHLEAALHQKDELLTQMQGARAARQNALRQEVNHLEEQIPVLQRQLDLAKWRSRDTELPTRRLYTARNSRVEALLELQAMNVNPAFMLGLIWKQQCMDEVDSVAAAESPPAAEKQLSRVLPFHDWLRDVDEELDHLQTQWISFGAMRFVQPYLPDLSGDFLTTSHLILEPDHVDREEEAVLAAAAALFEPASAYQVDEDWGNQVLGPAPRAAEEWEAELLAAAAALPELAMALAAEDREAELMGGAAALPELSVTMAAEERAALLAARGIGRSAIAAALAAESLASVVQQPSDQRMAPQPVQSWPAPLQAGTEAGPGSLQEVCAAMHMQLLASQPSASHQAVVSGPQTVERTALLLTVQLQDLAIKEAFKLMTQGQCLTVQDGTQQQTGGVQIASQAQLGASAALQQPGAAPVAAEAPSSYQELVASAAKQQQALVQLILLELAAGAVVPASLIQELDVVAAIQQEAADAHIRQLAGGARVQQEAAAVLVAKMKAEQRQAAAEQRQAAADQDQLLLDLAQAKSERAQATGLLASAQSERDELRRELNDALAVPLVRPEALQRGVSTAKPLGAGTSGWIWKCWVRGHGVVALKGSRIGDAALRAEAEMNRRIPPHPCIAQSYGWSDAAGPAPVHKVMVMEYLDGTLDTVPRDANGHVAGNIMMQMLHDVASGLHHLHGLRLIHCDIKANNIGWCFRSDSSSNLWRHFKVIDFGCTLDEGSRANITRGICAPQMTPEMAYALEGEAVPLPPDFTFPADPKRDVWALGVTVIDVAVQQAWAGRSLKWDMWNQGDYAAVAVAMRDELLAAISGAGLQIDWVMVESVLGQDVTDIVKDCLSLLPNERPIMADIAERVALSLYRHLL